MLDTEFVGDKCLIVFAIFDTNMQHVTAICRNITVGHQRQQDAIKIRKWLITLNITLTELKGLFQVNKLK